VYIVTAESADSDTALDDVIKEVKGVISKDGFEKSTDPKDASGIKWEGKQFQVSNAKGDSSLSLQIAIDNQHAELVSQTTSAPLDSAEAKKFFSSLRINPDVIKAENSRKSEEFLKNFFQPKTFVGWAGLAMGGLGGITWL